MNDFSQLLLSEVGDSDSDSFLSWYHLDPFVTFGEGNILIRKKYTGEHGCESFTEKSGVELGKFSDWDHIRNNFIIVLMSRNICLILTLLTKFVDGLFYSINLIFFSLIYFNFYCWIDYRAKFSWLFWVLMKHLKEKSIKLSQISIKVNIRFLLIPKIVSSFLESHWVGQFRLIKVCSRFVLSLLFLTPGLFMNFGQSLLELHIIFYWINSTRSGHLSLKYYQLIVLYWCSFLSIFTLCLNNTLPTRNFVDSYHSLFLRIHPLFAPINFLIEWIVF